MIDAIRDDHGHILGFAKITRDISERREAQQNLEKIQRQLAESQKLDALGQLTGGVAHDFNNLLMIITGNIHILKRLAGNRRQGAARRPVDRKGLPARRIADPAVADLCPPAERQPANGRSLRAHSFAAGRARHRTRRRDRRFVNPSVDADVWPVTVDPGEFEAALVNLVVNARDAMPGGGTITIRASNSRLDDDAGPAISWPFGSRIPAPASLPMSSPRCSIRSSRPSRSARGRARPFAGAWLRASGRGHGDGGKRTRKRTRF